MRVIDSDFAQLSDDRVVLGILGDGAHAEDVTDAVDRLDHRQIDAVVLDVLHETAVDLQVIDREVAQVAEGAAAGAEVVEREANADRLARQDEIRRHLDVVYGDRLGQLETDGPGFELMQLGLLAHEVDEVRGVERGPGEVDAAGQWRAAALGLEPRIGGEKGGDDPAVDGVDQVEAFGGGQEAARRNDLAPPPDHAQQHLEMLSFRLVLFRV